MFFKIWGNAWEMTISNHLKLVGCLEFQVCVYIYKILGVPYLGGVGGPLDTGSYMYIYIYTYTKTQ